jgi:hypothetical protein
MRERRLVLLVLAAGALTVGAWAAVDPGSFYASFPLGRGWVAADGPYNEHLVRDFGALNLSLCLLTGVAAWRLRPDLVRLAAIVTLVYALPHLTYHAGHLEPYGAADGIANIAALSVNIALPLWLAISPAPRTSVGREGGHDAGGTERAGPGA